jgi:peptide/nickel transport system substrate-binding protein
MVDDDRIQSLTQDLFAGRLDRRSLFARAAALGLSASAVTAALGAGVGTAAAAPSASTLAALAATAQLEELPREKTLIVVRGGVQGKFEEAEIWNPFLPLGNHQLGSMLLYEPLAFYSAFEDKTTLWLAESFEYSPDYKQLTVKTRPGITWSDGTPFSAEDVAYTFNQLVAVGSAVKWGADVQQFLTSAEATDDTTTVFTFKVAAPRFFEFISYKFDIGVFIVPRHIFEGQDWATFTHFDMAKGWPVTTSPWRVVYAAPEQKILDRQPDWWGVAAGVGKLPEPERYVYLPDPGEQGLAAGVIANDYDIATGLQPATFETVFNGNDKTITWTGKEAPYGNIDWWPHSLYLNNEKAPYDDPNVRWAISYYLDRQQIIDSAGPAPTRRRPSSCPTTRPSSRTSRPSRRCSSSTPYLEYNPEKGDALLTAKGGPRTTGVEDASGAPVELEIISFSTSPASASRGRAAEAGRHRRHLRRAADIFTRFCAGDYTAACSATAGATAPTSTTRCALYQTASTKIPAATWSTSRAGRTPSTTPSSTSSTGSARPTPPR